MGRLPASLEAALAPITIIAGHYGSGKTNLSVNLALDLVDDGREVTLVDLDIVNPYFRASEQRALLEQAGVRLVAPVFSEAGTGLDVPSLTGAIAPSFEQADDTHLVIVDLGGDDVGATALGRFSKTVAAHPHAMLYVLNRHRNLMADPDEAVENLREIEAATRLRATALVDNAHLKGETDEAALRDEDGYAEAVSSLSGLPLVAKTVPETLAGDGERLFTGTKCAPLVYPVRLYVKNPWE
ncbi:MAG: hypothetical protein V8R08_07800 [Coriobacteriales bacterium]